MLGQPLPASLAKEGGMMLQALLVELKSLAGIQVCVPLDVRCTKPAMASAAEIVYVDAGQDITSLLADLLIAVDLFWPIAPESDGILQSLAELAARANVVTCLSATRTLALCAHKYSTYQALVKSRIPVVETRLFHEGVDGLGESIVVKIADGVGCVDSVVVQAQEFSSIQLGTNQPANYILQPYLLGQAASLSCLFRDGKAWLVCYNHQQIVLQQGRFSLQSCLVNVQTDKLGFYRELIQDIARALPDLWGYIGIDLIECPEQGPLVLEINPRLTSSYVGIQQSTGINVAEQVLRLRHAEPILQRIRDETVYVGINGLE